MTIRKTERELTAECAGVRVGIRAGGGFDDGWVYRTDSAEYGIRVSGCVGHAEARESETTGTRVLWTDAGVTVTELRFRGGFSRFCDADECFLVARGGGKIKLGERVETFEAGDLLDLTAYRGVCVLELGEVGTLLKISFSEDV